MIYFNQIIKLFSSKQFLKMPKVTTNPKTQPVCVGLPNLMVPSNPQMSLIGLPLHAKLNILKIREQQIVPN